MSSAPPCKVTVLVMTYNHRRFISQALDSVLAQETDFNFEILVSEDCSTDGTREIVTDYAERYGARFRLVLSERNLRSNRVVARGIEQARGDYVALLDGDDYWTSADKLQRQANFLDSRSECSLCFHNAAVVHDDGRQQPRNWTPPEQPELSTVADIWLGNFIATCSTMFRRGLFQLPAWYDDFFPITDWPLHILNAEHGALGYIDQVMGAYRYHAGGLYSPLEEADKLACTRDFYRRMNACLDYRHNRLAKIGLAKYFVEWAEEYAARGDRTNARACLKTALAGRPVNRHVGPRRLLRLCWRIFGPPGQRLQSASRR